MATTTVTEALAEIKTIGKRIEKKRQFVQQYLYRQQIVRDPLENQGGSPKSVAAELQGVRDLEERIVALRRGIARVNATYSLTITGTERTIGDWLTWRREVAPKRQAALATLRSQLISIRQQQTAKGGTVSGESLANPSPGDVIVNVDERALSTEAEQIEEVLGTLDGLLSLKNATITFEV